ncbi:MAG: phage major capsid protein [Armatimonadota bacterium]
MAITIDTLNAVTKPFWPKDKMTNTVMRSTPIFEYLKRGMKPGSGTKMQFDVEYARLGGGNRTATGQMTLTTPEIATQGEMAWAHYYVPVKLEQLYIEMNESDPQKVANYLNMYTASALETMREKHLAPDLFTPHAGNAMWSIADAVSDSASYAGLAKADIPSWRAVTAEGTYNAPNSVGVSPSLENIRRMIRRIKAVSGKTPDLVAVDTDLWDMLASQLDNNDNVSAQRQGSDVIKWGFDAIFVNGVPIIDDINLPCPGEFVANSVSRATAKGHTAYFLNFDNLFLYYLPSRKFTWDKMGWVSSQDYTDYINKIYFTGNIGCTLRRSQGVMYGIDIAQSPSAWTPVAIDITPFAVV